MHEKRRWPRYDITPIPSVTATIATIEAPTRLGTIGMGGCGIWIDAPAAPLTAGQEIQCSISFEGILPRSLEITGTVQYLRAMERDKKNYLYCGIEFKPGFEDRMAPVIRQLEKLEKLGRILIAVD